MPCPDTSFTGPELCALSAREVTRLLARGEVSPAELVEASLERVEAVSPAVNATVTTCPDRARKAAADDHTATLLGGLPVGIKDLNPVAGVRTTWGTPALAGHVPETSDIMVTRLEARGAIVIGKTNTPEMGAGGNTFNPVFGATRNPWDTSRNPGGSSGGAAASLATGEAWLSQGSDLGGSLRTPAAYCGVVGLRPSPGLVASSGANGFGMEGVQGPMARDVADCALFLDAMAGWDARVPVSYPPDNVAYLDSTLQDPGRLTIAYSPDLGGFTPCEPGVDAALQRALGALERTGDSVETTCPDLPDLDRTYRTLRGLVWVAGLEGVPAEVQARFKPTLQQNADEGRALTATDIGKALVGRSRIYDIMAGFFGTFDVLACPVAGLQPLASDIEYPTHVNGVEMPDYLGWLSFSFLSTTAGLPAISVPVGFDAGGLPIGIQLIGPPRGEARLLQIAYKLEQTLDLPKGPIDPIQP